MATSVSWLTVTYMIADSVHALATIQTWWRTTLIDFCKERIIRLLVWYSSAAVPIANLSYLKIYEDVCISVGIWIVTKCHMIVSHWIILYPIITFHISFNITSRHVTSHHITSHHVTSHHIMTCYAMSHHVISQHVMTCHVMSYQIISRHIMSHHITSYWHCHHLIITGMLVMAYIELSVRPTFTGDIYI